MDGKSISSEQLRSVILGDSYFDYRDRTLVNPQLKIDTRDASLSGSILQIVFHSSLATNWTPDRLSRYFVDERKFPICGYHYYIDRNKVYHMVSENIITYHCAPHNDSAIGFAINFDSFHDEPLNVQLDVNIYELAVRLASFLCLKFHVKPIEDYLVGHNELPLIKITKRVDKFTGRKNQSDHNQIESCPGSTIDLKVFRQRVTRQIQTTLKQQLEMTDFAVDGIFGPKSEIAFNTLLIHE